MEDDKVPAGGDEPTETSSDNLNARVTIEVSGHHDEPEQEPEPQIEDDEEAA